MSRPLIIGFGNPLREDDALGWRAAELLERREGARIDVLKCHQLTPELADLVGRASLVIFLDAAVSQEPGAILTRLVERSLPAAWSHQLSPAQLIGFSEQVTGSAPRAYVITGGIDRMTWSECMTGCAEICAARLAASAQRLLGNSL